MLKSRLILNEKKNLIFRTASSFVLSYYGLEMDKRKKRKICAVCQASSEDYRLKLRRDLSEGKSVLADKLPVPKEFVLLEDSDEESETDCSEESEFEVDLSSASASSSDEDNLSAEERLEKMIGKSLKKFNLEYQFTAAEQNLYKR